MAVMGVTVWVCTIRCKSLIFSVVLLMTAATGLIVDFNMTQTSHLYSILTLPLPLGMNLDKVGSVPIIVCSKKAHSVDTEKKPK